MNYRKLFIYYFVTLIGIFISVGGCKNKESTKNGIFLKLIFSDELAGFVSAALKEIAKNPIKTSSNKIVNIEEISITSPLAANAVANGSTKNHLWLAPSLFVRLANSNVSGLGATSTECVTLAESPIVLAGVRKVPSEFLQYLSGARDFTEDFAEQLLLSHQERGLSGISGLLALSHLNKRDPLPIKLQKIKRVVAREFIFEKAMLEHILRAKQKKLNQWALTTEQQVILANRSIADNIGQLKATYFADPSRALRYQLCASSASWISAEERAAALELIQRFSAPNIRNGVSKFGLRPVSYQSDQEPATSLSPTSGVEKNYKIKDFEEEELPVAKEILTEWIKTRGSHQTTLIFDTSASMEGETLAAAQLAAVQTLRSLGNFAEITLISASSNPAVILTNTRDPEKIIQELFSLRCVGGSAVYDSILTAYNQSYSVENNNQIILITDGNDNSSRISQKDLIEKITDQSKGKGIILTILAIKTKETDNFEDLDLIAQSVNGRLIVATPKQVSLVSEQLRENF
ncbi:MAG TPA: vWA domain-containing protein [Oligoflexia bacterium]|nr:vWA domain-containing protein [Oligoflexia bacterium]HMP27501.1 vWA domain-containing protein [Oligoflexia bacterium]